MTDVSWRHRWRWLLMPLALAALAWAVWLLWDALPALRNNLPRLDVGWLVLVLCGNVLSGYLGFEAFRTLFGRMRPKIYRRLPLAHLYFTGQLMKHLPGRIWGVAYQAAAARGASSVEWISVTVTYMLLSTWFALWTAVVVLGWSVGWSWGVAALVVGAALYAFGWNAQLLTVLLDLLRRLPWKIFDRLSVALTSFADVDVAFKLRILCWFAASWLLYLLAWAGYGMAWPGLVAIDGIQLCALYTLAWFVGYISFFAPSGIGVRELVFVALASHFPPDAVAGMAVLGRVVLLCVDLLLGAAFIPFKRTVK